MLLTIFLVLSCSFAFAHEARPCYLEIIQQQNSLHITWKNLMTDRSGVELTPAISGIHLGEPTKTTVSGSYFIQQWQVNAPENLAGKTIFINGLNQSFLRVLVRVQLNDKQPIIQLLTSEQSSFTIENQSSGSNTSEYIWLGITHIWTGIDHLLFVLGLVLLAKNIRSLVQTITAFTIAHSITLAMATLGMVHVHSAPVEAIIALSIVFLALELVRHYEGINRLSYHYPWLVAFAFGLLHGFGFAGALSETGLPENGIAKMLLLFNVGVEVGQLAFVAILLCLGWLFRKTIRTVPVWVKMVPAYAIGSLATCWFLERVLAVVNP